MLDTTCLRTVVRNVSGERKFFGFLGPRGTELDDNEEFTILGSLPDYVARGSYGDRSGPHWTDGMLYAVGENADSTQLLEVVSTPAPILYDPTAEESKMLVLDAETLGTMDPCWASEAA